VVEAGLDAMPAAGIDKFSHDILKAHAFPIVWPDFTIKCS
jgi:hypothetical protein